MNHNFVRGFVFFSQHFYPVFISLNQYQTNCLSVLKPVQDSSLYRTKRAGLKLRNTADRNTQIWPVWGMTVRMNRLRAFKQMIKSGSVCTDSGFGLITAPPHSHTGNLVNPISKVTETASAHRLVSVKKDDGQTSTVQNSITLCVMMVSRSIIWAAVQYVYKCNYRNSLQKFNDRTIPLTQHYSTLLNSPKN